MLFTTSLSFTLTVVVCASQVVAMPVQGPTDDLHAARSALAAFRRSQLELEELSAALMRRTGDKKTSARSASKSSAKGSTITLCRAKGSRKKRSIEELLFPRDHTIAEFDSTGANKVTHVLGAADGIGSRFGGGSNGEIFRDPNDANVLIKHFQSDGGNKDLDQNEVLTEVDALKAVKQLVEPMKFKYFMGPSKNPKVKVERLYHFWVWMKKMDGKKLAELLEGMDQNTRRTFLDKVKPLVIAQALHHTTVDKRFHMDITVENVLVVMNGQEPKSVNIVDWGLVEHGDCIPEPEKAVTSQVEAAFARFYE